jgi:K+-sensing histidine kinase KdpD
LVSLALFPPLAPVPPPPFHPARNQRSQPITEQAMVLAPSGHSPPLPASEQIRLIREAGRAFAAATRPPEVLRALLCSLKPLSCFFACSVLLADDAGPPEVYVVAQHTLSACFLEQHIGRLGREARRLGLPQIHLAPLAQIEVLDGSEEEDNAPASMPAEQMEFFLSHALMSHDVCVGVLGLAEAQAGKAPKEQAELLPILLDAAAARLENLRLQRAKQVLWEEVSGERQRIEQWKDAFLSSVSHELRTPLTPIKGYTQLLLRRATRRLAEATSQESADQTKVTAAIRYEQCGLESIQSAAEHLERLVNTLLDVSLLQRGKLQLHCRPVDLAEVIEQTARSVQLSAEQHELMLRREAGAAMVWADSERLQAVIGNLLENAMKHSPPGGAVQVSLLEQEQGYVVEVSDQGDGVSPERRAHLFERFPSAVLPGVYPAEGIGVSLYHAQAILQLHGGSIWAEANHQGDGGSTLAFVLPRYMAEAE